MAATAKSDASASTVIGKLGSKVCKTGAVVKAFLRVEKAWAAAAVQTNCLVFLVNWVSG
jgi:hypothetical protein